MYVTRAELFEWVWQQPRTTLARQLKISDVAVAKKCRAANIPMPPPGYWAQLAAGKRQNRPALPLRVPGEPDLIAFGEPRYASITLSSSEEVPTPPSFAEDVEVLVDAAAKVLGPVKPQRDLADPHSGLTRLLNQEEERRRKFAETKWSYYEPRFEDGSSQRQLRIYSALFRAFSKLGVKGTVSDEPQWKRGFGTQNRLCGGLDFRGTWVQLSMSSAHNNSASTSLKFLVGSDEEAKAHSVFSDEPDLKIEKRLDLIARSILVCAEQQMRAHAQHVYCLKLRELERRAREREQELRASEARQAAQLAREQEVRRRGLYAAAARRRRAVEVRSLVSAMQGAHPELAADAIFAGWCEFALAEADRLDPVQANWTAVLKTSPANADLAD